MPETSSNSEPGLHLRFEGHDYEKQDWVKEEAGVTVETTDYKFRYITLTVRSVSRATQLPQPEFVVPEGWYESV